MSVSQTMHLIKRHQGRCHYCNERTDRKIGSPRQATKEHVVPRAFGGANSIENYVLACSDCNNKRGTHLFFCMCDHCSSLINYALKDNSFINQMFEGILKHNKPVVSRRPCRIDKPWQARKGHVTRYFETWSEAVDYAHNGTFMRGE